MTQRPIAILNRQHGQKGTISRFDPGAVHEHLREVDLVSRYFDTVERVLIRNGVVVHRINTGSYDNRNNRVAQIARANKAVPVLHVLGHVNSAIRPGTTGIIFSDSRSQQGPIAAGMVADKMRSLPELTRVLEIRTEKGDQWSRVRYCLDPTYRAPHNCYGILLEPGFINSPSHAPLWTVEGLERLGKSIGAGIAQYLVGN